MIAVKHTGLRALFAILWLVLINGCTDLNIDNLNNPDTSDVLATSDDIIRYAGDAYRIWNNAIQDYSGPALAMGGMADELTSSWGMAGSKDLSEEPRHGFNNDIMYAYSYINRHFWNMMYSVVGASNDVLRRIEADDMVIIQNGKDVTGMVKAWCYFIQGIAHGYLGLLFDKAYIIDWDTDLTSLSFSPYAEVDSMGLFFLDKSLAAIDASPDFVLPDGYIRGYNLTKSEFRQLVSSFAARILAYVPRNATQNAAVDWNRVLQYAQEGIDFDLMPDLDDRTWIDNFKGYAVYPGFDRIDHRIINLMDHDYPSRWPSDNMSWNTPDGQDPGPATSADARLDSDFEFLYDNNYKPDRGYYFFSHYRYQRYDAWLQTWKGPTPMFWKWENDLLIAEALVRANGDVAGAAAILNDPNGARKVRGGLPDVAPASAEEALELIFYERGVELAVSQGGISYFDMRRRDMLQRGTILHFPVPGAELEILGLPYYTIEGPPDGENISEGSWTGYDGLTSPPE